MTARYGRNQRRAARAQIQQLVEELSEANMSAVQQRILARAEMELATAKIRALEAIVNETAERLRRALGDGTALLPLDVQRRLNGRREPHARREPLRRDLDGYICDAAVPQKVDVSADFLDLIRLVMEVENRPQHFRTMIRIVDGGVGPGPQFSPRAIWISADAMKTIGLIGSDREHFLRQVIDQLIELPVRRHGRV